MLLCFSQRSTRCVIAKLNGFRRPPHAATLEPLVQCYDHNRPLAREEAAVIVDIVVVRVFVSCRSRQQGAQILRGQEGLVRTESLIGLEGRSKGDPTWPRTTPPESSSEPPSPSPHHRQLGSTRDVSQAGSRSVSLPPDYLRQHGRPTRGGGEGDNRSHPQMDYRCTISKLAFTTS